MKEYIETLINEHLPKIGIDKKINLQPISEQLSHLGDYCFIINSLTQSNHEEYAKSLGNKIQKLGEIDKVELVIKEGKKAKTYFLNLFLTSGVKSEYNSNLIESTIKMVHSADYGKITDLMGESIVVEHTSANPIAPIHVGNLRNSIQGDTFKRILEYGGAKVYVHFLVNDGGLQIGFTVIGFEILKKNGIKPDIKFDLWIGRVYAIMNLFYNTQIIKQNLPNQKLKSNSIYKITKKDIHQLNSNIENKLIEIYNQIENLKKTINKASADKNIVKKINSEINQLKRSESKELEKVENMKKLYNSYNVLKSRFPDIFKILETNVSKIDLKELTTEYIYKYENNLDENISSLFREMAEWCIICFQATLKQYNIEFDSFDFESDVSWSKQPQQFVEKLSKFDNVENVGEKAMRFNYTDDKLNEFYKFCNINKPHIPIKGKIPDLQLTRSDGTVLYPAKDIAYSVTKFEKRKANRVYNVIGSEQTSPQFQLLLPLYQLGYKEYAKNLFHFSYEIVQLVGRKMSGRLASYITADEFYTETLLRARMAKRVADAHRGVPTPKSDDEWDKENRILHAVTLASSRFPLIENSPRKKIELDLDRELDFKQNTGPFVQYAHARANGIKKKIMQEIGIQFTIDGSYYLLALDELTVNIIKHLEAIQNTVRKSINTQDPSKIADWVFKLAQYFMKFYDEHPILNEPNHELQQVRLNLVETIRVAIAKGLEILGIPAAEEL
jgi:arginyl-tRNA synthetase